MTDTEHDGHRRNLARNEFADEVAAGSTPLAASRQSSARAKDALDRGDHTIERYWFTKDLGDPVEGRKLQVRRSRDEDGWHAAELLVGLHVTPDLVTVGARQLEVE